MMFAGQIWSATSLMAFSLPHATTTAGGTHFKTPVP